MKPLQLPWRKRESENLSGQSFSAPTPHRANYQEILGSVCQVCRTKNVSGCSAIGVLSGAEEVEGEPAVVVLAVSSPVMRARLLLCMSLELVA